MTSASPGVIANLLQNESYPNEEAYLYALAEVMKVEYKAIVDAGLLLQMECPDLAMARVSQFSHPSVEEVKRTVEMHVEVINFALTEIDPQRMRLHLCRWNTEGPHHHDIPLREIVELAMKAKPLGISFEGANPHHAHEWRVWEDVKLPEGKALIPGVLDTTANFTDHPDGTHSPADTQLRKCRGTGERHGGQRLWLWNVGLGTQGGGQHRLAQARLDG